MTKAVQEQAKRTEMQLQAIRRAMRSEFHAEIEKGNLTAPQKLVMSEVVKQDGVSLKELSRRVSLAHSTVSGIVDRLEKQGLVKRQTARDDKRVSLIVASAPVREFLEHNLPQLTRGPLMRALEAATPAERKAIAAGLDTLERLLGR